VCFVARRRENSSVLRATSVQCVSCYWRSTLARTAPPAAISAAAKSTAAAAPFASAFSRRSAHAVVRVKGLRLDDTVSASLRKRLSSGDGASLACTVLQQSRVTSRELCRAGAASNASTSAAWQAGDAMSWMEPSNRRAPRLLQHGSAGSNAALSRALAAGIRNWTL